MKKLVLSVALFATVATASGQEVPPAGETIDVEIINVDVVVTDRQGKRIHGLSEDDFVILENGKEHPVTNLTEYRSRSAAAQVDVSSASSQIKVEEAPPKTVVVFVDRLNLPPHRLREFYEPLTDLVKKVIEPGDRIHVYSWARSLKPRVIGSSDVREVEKLFAKMSKEGFLGGSDGSRDEVDREVEMEDELVEISPEFTATGGATSARALAARAYNDIKTKAAAIRSIMASISGAPGRKIMILGMRRFSRFAGLEFFVPFGSMVGPTPRDAREFDTLTIMQSVTEAANAHAVTLYGFYPGSIKDIPANPTERMKFAAGANDDARQIWLIQNEGEVLDMLAKKTGGVSAYGPQDVTRAILSSESDFTDYYSLAYRATSEKKPGTRRLEVRTKTAAYVVRHRESRVQRSLSDEARDQALAALSGAKFDGLIKPRIDVRADQWIGKKRRNKIEVRIPISQLYTQPEANDQKSGRFAIYVATSMEGQGINPAVAEFRQPIRYPASEEEKRRKGHVTYEFDIEGDGAATTVAVVVVDELGQERGYGTALIKASNRNQKMQTQPMR